MAKKSMIAREAKRARTVAKFAAKRAQLKEVIANVNTCLLYTSPSPRDRG